MVVICGPTAINGCHLGLIRLEILIDRRPIALRILNWKERLCGQRTERLEASSPINLWTMAFRMSIFGLRHVVFYLGNYTPLHLSASLFGQRYVSCGPCIGVWNFRNVVNQDCGMSLSP